MVISGRLIVHAPVSSQRLDSTNLSASMDDVRKHWANSAAETRAVERAALAEARAMAELGLVGAGTSRGQESKPWQQPTGAFPYNP